MYGSERRGDRGWHKRENCGTCARRRKTTRNREQEPIPSRRGTGGCAGTTASRVEGAGRGPVEERGPGEAGPCHITPTQENITPLEVSRVQFTSL